VTNLGSPPAGVGEKPHRQRGRVFAASVFTFIAGTTLAIPLAAPAHAAPVYCGGSEYIEQIEVEPWAEGHQKIKVYPTGAARHDINPRHVTNNMWHAVQKCVRGLHGDRADRIYDQLECHQHLAMLKHYRGDQYGGYYTGPTYDLETWHEPFSSNHVTWASVECGNKMTDDPEPEGGPLGPPRRPDARDVDPFNNIA
jgi:hypothetical protein